MVLDCGAGDVWDLDKAMNGWVLGESLVFLLLEDDENDVHGDKCCLLESLKTMSHSHSERMHRVFARNARTTFKRKEEHCGIEARFVGPTRLMGVKRLEIKIKTAVAGGRLWKKLHRVLKIVGRIPKREESRRRFSREFNNWPLPLKKKSHTWKKSCK